MATMTDGEVDAGPSPRFEELCRRELAAVVALAYVLSGSRTAAGELAQNAFLAAHRSWDRIGCYDDPAAWVRRVCATGPCRWCAGGPARPVPW